MDLSIIIVSWNVKNLLRENLKAIFGSAETQNFAFEIFVVDNSSKDGTVEMIKREFPTVNLIANNHNAGFAKANNQAIKKACGEFILLLNPDMCVLRGTLADMIKWMRENRQAAIAGCHLIDKNGNTINHVRRFPTVWDQLAIVLKLPHIFPKILDKYLMRNFDYSQAASVDSVRGSFFMIRREAIEKLGGLDERYFIWFEEVDFCKQIVETQNFASNCGEIWYTPAAKCVDYVGKSFSQIKTGTTQKYFRDSMLKYFKKWHPLWQYWILKIAWPIGAFVAEKANFKSKIKT
ncbi:glycosyltransferase family 2 protein [Candidatus Parcubacteria bacterium]|nr:glycosyltransferase family 2 protein [Candidatus Parcubacteria bacterium]